MTSYIRSILHSQICFYGYIIINNMTRHVLITEYRGDRRGQNIESSNMRPSRHPHHRNYPLPLPPMSDVVTNSMRKRNRYNRNKQPVCTYVDLNPFFI